MQDKTKLTILKAFPAFALLITSHAVSNVKTAKTRMIIANAKAKMIGNAKTIPPSSVIAIFAKKRAEIPWSIGNNIKSAAKVARPAIIPLKIIDFLFIISSFQTYCNIAGGGVKQFSILHQKLWIFEKSIESGIEKMYNCFEGKK